MCETHKPRQQRLQTPILGLALKALYKSVFTNYMVAAKRQKQKN